MKEKDSDEESGNKMGMGLTTYMIALSVFTSTSVHSDPSFGGLGIISLSKGK